MITEFLFQPMTIGNLELPNRVVMTTIKLGYGTPEGNVTDRHIAFYVRRAQGAVGLITTEPMYVQTNGRELPTQLGAHQDQLVEGLQKMVAAVHAAGGRMMAHINHAGRAANPNLVPKGELISASDVLCPANQVTPRELTSTEIKEIILAFSQAVRRAREAGFDALEIPFSHGYLIHQFLSPHTNLRQDEYGGSFENRLRFGREVIATARDHVGDDFPIVIRMNAKDYVEDGLELEDACLLAQALEKMGVNALSITSGTMCESVPYCLYPSGTPKANLLPMAARIREVSGLPIIVAGRIRSPDIAREALSARQTDLIGLARPLLADPDWVQKTQAGEEEGILLCAACHQGCLAELRKGHGTSCMFNPMTGRESEVEITPTSKPRKVMIVGGGPAGLEAGTIAASRGHHVTLYEQNDHLGGQLNLAAQPPYKEEFRDVIRHFEWSVGQAGVEVHLGTSVNAEMVHEVQPEVLILSTGGIPLTIHFPGLEETHWILASDLLEGLTEVKTETTFVIGGGMVGLETADFLAERGKRVTVVEMLDTLGGDMDKLATGMIMKRLKAFGVSLHTGTKVIRLTKNSAIAQGNDGDMNFPIETVIMAVGVRPNRTLVQELQGDDIEIYVIGDAKEPRKALEAIYEGFEVGRKL